MIVSKILGVMKKFILIVFMILSVDLYSQKTNLTSLEGIWRWQDTATDSEFEISIKKINFNWPQYLGGQLDSALVGGYRYKKDGKILVEKLSEVYVNKDSFEYSVTIYSWMYLNICDYLTKNGRGESKYLSDQSRIEIVSKNDPKQIRWIIEDNSERIVVGLSDEEVDSLVFPDGTALPTDIVLTKIE